MKRNQLLLTALCIALLGLSLFQTPTETPQTREKTTTIDSSATKAATISSPYAYSLGFQEKPPEQSSTLLQARDSGVSKLSLPSTASGGIPSNTGMTGPEDYAAQPSTESLTDFGLFTNSTVQIPSAPTSLVNEPSVAQKNHIIFYTGNWYAARSTDGGTNWTYTSPFTDMNDFCCDQDTLYNPSRGIFLWYRMGRPQLNGTNRFLLGVSTDASLWYFYNIHPADINPAWSNQIFDFIIMAYSSNYLYITNNLFQNETYTNSLIMKVSLDNLKSHSSNFLYDYSFAMNGGFAPVQGAKQTMYFATHLNTAQLQLYVWPESLPNSLISSSIIPHPSFTATDPGNATCTAPDGGDICRRVDDRILGGWVSKGVVGFFWNVKQGSGFVKPYTYVIRINETLKTLINTPYIYNPNYAWVYPWISPNARGDLGLVAFTAGSTRYPRIDIGIMDATSGSTWQLYPGGVATSTNGPETSCITGSYACWGDFVRVRPFNGTGNSWVATGYTLHGGRTGSFVEPRYMVFGRVSDYPYNYSVVTFHTVPSVVGSITFNGTTYKDGQKGIFNLTGRYVAQLNLPPNHTFARWNGTAGVFVSNPLVNPTNVTLAGFGDLIAVMIPPNITITFRTNPSSAGSITCSGQTFTNGQIGLLPSNSTISCTAVPPAGMHLASWTGLASGTSNLVNFFSGNGGTVTANFSFGASLPPIGLLTAALLTVFGVGGGRVIRRRYFARF